MAGSEQVAAHAAVTAIAETADSLLNYMCGCQYVIGADHYLRVHRLLASLAASGKLPNRAKELEHWVRPLICESAREQEKFERDFEDWLRARGEAESDFVPPHDAFNEALRQVGRGWTQWLIAGSIGVLMLTGTLTLWLTGKSGQAVPRATPEPMFPILHWFVAAMLALAIGLFGIWALLWRRSKTKAFLVQREASRVSSSTSVPVARVDPPIYDSRLLAVAAQGFGIYRRLPSENLNVRASVAATAREAGRFTPILAERPAVPEYLILIDRASTEDLFARFADGMARKLEESNVAIDQFYFDRNPQQCYAKRGYRPVTIRDLQERFPEHRVLVFSDGAGFLNLLASQYASWMDTFGNWEVKTLITPNPRAYWGVRENLIAEAGWSVIPAEQEELAALAQDVQADKTDEAFVPGLLGSITARGQDLLRRSALPPEQVQDLLMDLRISLGAAGFYWLCACAVYPGVDWKITLYLGSALQDEDGKALLRETAFLALARLPWFRYGGMPEWVRLALLAKLSPEQLQRVRHALQDFMMKGLDGQVGAHRIEIHSHLRQPLTWFTRQYIRMRARKLDEEDPLRDEIFVEFLRGANPAALPLPQRIANLFRGGARGEWMGHSPLTWKLLGLTLLVQLASQGAHTAVRIPGPALLGLAMLAGGMLADTFSLRRGRLKRYLFGSPIAPGAEAAQARSASEQTVVVGALIVFAASIVNAISGDYVSFGVTKIGFGLLWPAMAMLVARRVGRIRDAYFRRSRCGLLPLIFLRCCRFFLCGRRSLQDASQAPR